jgi:hypothetical protein
LKQLSAFILRAERKAAIVDIRLLLSTFSDFGYLFRPLSSKNQARHDAGGE